MAKRSATPAPPSEPAPVAPPLKVEQWAVGRLTPYPKNARVIPDSAVDTVARSLKEYGWQQPIVVDEGGVVVVGHTRLMAAKKLGMKTVPVHVMRGVSQDKIDAYRLMDNRSNQETMWDNDVLIEELSALKAAGYDLLNTGFTEAELQAHLSNMDTGSAVAAVVAGAGASGGGEREDREASDVPRGAIRCPRCKKHFVPGK